MDWFRSHHGAPTDPKWVMIARRANVTQSHASVTPGHVASVWWALMDYASQQNDRGSVAGFDAEELAAFFGYDEEQVAAILSALREKRLITTDDRLASWQKRQPEREDTTASERKRRQRDRQRQEREQTGGGDVSRNVTNGHAPDTDTEKNTVTNVTDATASPREVIFDLGVKILTHHGNSEPSARSFLGKHARGNETKLAETIAYLAANPKIEPKAYIAKALQPKERRVVV
jgi:hypothetical protein